ncbi:hypothetical protein CkaCkLH20_08604 [Colletotrichum karsti]|uniref:SGNH hydrolase-type esterase domain-containing protein n=1 Tax=Colletotrichum karsti TaxID=1095194 RepID=A0A9P6LIM1_9PEZI|nr:uncharacterized protein CkaCkLH20_08604 [Colletotrichum karsti]KAF9873870.1 hypothetical protein CkaCkLH20_08604 [Colletotrichum karsti]
MTRNTFLALWACVLLVHHLYMYNQGHDQAKNLKRDLEVFQSANATYTSFESRPINLNLRKRADKVPLRILSLGASIVWGVGSSQGNSFRKPLRDRLRYDGWEVNMVGSLRNGQMQDNDVQATPGDIIDQARQASKSSLKYLPNLVLINIGTNDCSRNIDIPNAGARLRQLLEELWSHPGMDRSTVVLSTVIPSHDGNIEPNRPSVNAQYRALVKTLRAGGRSIVLADMDPEPPSPAHGWIAWPADMYDGIHPNDEGFKKMASIFHRAITRAWNAGMLRVPEPSDAVDNPSANPNCEMSYGDGVYAGGLTQKGSGQHDGIYQHASTAAGSVLTIASQWDRDQFRFAKLFGRGRSDLVAWWLRDDGTAMYGVWRNTGNEEELFVKIPDMSVRNNCGINGVHFADINADGLDDFFCVGKDGAVYASVNQGDGTASSPPTFKSVGLIRAARAGYDQSRVRLGDIDGDGRCDVCYLEANGDIRCFRNGLNEDKPSLWQDLGVVFTGKGMGDLEGVRFYDLNGDGRDDWLWVDDNGATTTWTNSRSCNKNKLAVWRQGFWRGATSGPTHYGVGGTARRSKIHFARVYNSPQDFGLLGRADYVYIEHHNETATGGGAPPHRFEVKAWRNQGSGSTKLVADGDKYCNMKGYADGRADYVWVHSRGGMTLYPNLGRTSVADGKTFWGMYESNIFDPASFGRSLDRRDLFLADWDGDGTCDVVWVNPDAQNRVEVWINNYPKTKTWSWTHLADPAPQLSCPERRGLGLFDLPVAFADMTGNGRADYLCMEKDGRTWGWVHNDDGSWERINQFKRAEGADRANLRWADVNGDGRDDMIWLDKFTGDGRVYYNWGRAEVGGSQFDWRPKGALYQGAVAGACEYFPDLDGNGRADLHAIKGSWTNEAETWFNMCGTEGKGDDAGGVVNPGLPVQPGVCNARRRR